MNEGVHSPLDLQPMKAPGGILCGAISLQIPPSAASAPHRTFHIQMACSWGARLAIEVDPKMSRAGRTSGEI